MEETSGDPTVSEGQSESENSLSDTEVTVLMEKPDASTIKPALFEVMKFSLRVEGRRFFEFSDPNSSHRRRRRFWLRLFLQSRDREAEFHLVTEQTGKPPRFFFLHAASVLLPPAGRRVFNLSAH